MKKVEKMHHYQRKRNFKNRSKFGRLLSNKSTDRISRADTQKMQQYNWNMGRFLHVWLGRNRKQKLQPGLEQEIEANRNFQRLTFLLLVDK